MFRYRCNSHSFKLFRTVLSTTIFKSTENWYNLHSIYKYLQHMCAKLSFDSTWSQQVTKPASFTTIQRNLIGIFLLSRLKYQIRCLYFLGTPNLVQGVYFQSLELFVISLYCKSKVPLNVKILGQLKRLFFPKTSWNHRRSLQPMQCSIKKFFCAHYTPRSISQWEMGKWQSVVRYCSGHASRCTRIHQWNIVIRNRELLVWKFIRM